MAGIGFVLRRLAQKETLSGAMQGYLHATVVSTGPWLMTVLAMGIIFFFTVNASYVSDVATFRYIIMYNFCFSAVFCSPFVALSTRYLADCIHAGDLEEAAGMLVGSLTVMSVLLVPIAAAFYFGYTTLPWYDAALAVVQFLLLAATALVAVFLSALKNYRVITYSFLLGLAVAVIATTQLADRFHLTGMLIGFSAGLVVITASIMAQIFGEYPRVFRHVFRVVSYGPKYWLVALAAFLYSAGLWIDKWIMWLSPNAFTAPTGFIMYPPYDSAMFLAYLTIVPAMAIFVLNQETQFFEHYLKFYRGILGHRSYKTIQKNHEGVVDAILDTGRAVLLLQAFCCTACVVLAPKIFQALDLSFAGIGMFRYGVLGVTFNVFHLFICIFLSYLDYRKGALLVSVVFVVSNAFFTYVTIKLGYPFYGYGYFLSNIVTFITAAVVLERYVRILPYNTFIANNTALKH